MIILFRGISGSGKSSLAEAYRTENWPTMVTPAIEHMKQLAKTTRARDKSIFSADNYFMVDGEYKFEASQLSMAHQDCLKKYTETIRKSDDADVLMVDNTNCSVAECAPYMALAGAYQHRLSVVTLVALPVDAFRRNKHKVPFDSTCRQSLTLNDSIANWPPWFPQRIFPA
jgi:GTPase SAR1 family protein